MASGEISLSVIKADIGGLVGHSGIHPDLLSTAEEHLAAAKAGGKIVDYHVTNCGDDLNLIMTHTEGDDSETIHALAWSVFEAGRRLQRSSSSTGRGRTSSPTPSRATCVGWDPAWRR